MIKASNTRIAENGIDHVHFCRFVFGRQQVGNYRLRVQFGKDEYGHYALLKARDMHRLKVEEPDE